MAGFGDSTDTAGGSFLGRAPDQVAFVVADLEEGVTRYGQLFGVSKWVCWDYTSDYLPHRTYRDAPSDYRSLAAVPASYGPKVEVIQPIDGPSVFTTFLEDRTEGLHHLGWFVPDLAAVREHFAGLGVAEIMSGGGHGVQGDGEFCYFDTFPLIGAYAEFIQVPAKRFAPHFEIDVDLSGRPSQGS